MIVLQLRASNSWFNPPIAFFTHSPEKLVHADAVMRDGRLLGSNIVPGVKPDGTPVKSGVAIRPMNYGNPVRTLIVRFACTQEQEDLFYATMESLCGVGFGLRRMLALARPYGSGKPWTERQGLFCSESIAYVFNLIGLVDPNHPKIEANAVSPRDLMEWYGAQWRFDDVVEFPENAGFWCHATHSPAT